MSPHRLATIAAIFSLLSGGAGLIAPAAMAGVVGLTLDPTGVALVRLACASYIGYAALNWFARGVTDGGAWRGIVIGNAVAWAAGTVVTVLAMASGLGDARLLGIVAVQLLFTLLWSAAAFDRSPARSAAAPSR